MTQSSPLRRRVFVCVLIAVLLAVLSGTQPALASPECTERWYLSPMIGAGTDEDSLRPLVMDLPNYPRKFFWTSWAVLYSPSDPQTGQMEKSWAFVSIAAENHQPLIHNRNLAVLPDLDMSTNMSDIDAETRKQMTEALVKFGIDTSIMDTAVTYADYLYFIAQWLGGDYAYIPRAECPPV